MHTCRTIYALVTEMARPFRRWTAGLAVEQMLFVVVLEVCEGYDIYK
jgi:hypothetical protein